MPFTPYKRFIPGTGYDARPRPRTGSRRWLVTELDRVCSWLTRKLYPFCVTCGEQRAHLLTCSHFYSRRFLHTRFDLRNLVTQCWNCNVQHSAKPYAYLTWLLENRGEDVLSELNELRMSRMKITDADLLKTLEERRAQLQQEASR